MKKLIVCLLIVCLMCSPLCSCGKKETAVHSAQSEEPSFSPTASQTVSEPISYDSGYTVTPGIYSDGKIRLCYPIISGLAFPDLEVECNRIFKHSLLQRTQNYSAGDLVEADFEVMTANDSLISVLTKGQILVDGSAQPYYFVQTLNIDLVQGRILRLADLCDINAAASSFSASEQTVFSPNGRTMEAVEYLSSLTDKERKKIFSRCDVSMGELYAEGYSYVKDGQLYVCQTVNHAIGDYSVCCLTGFTF